MPTLDTDTIQISITPRHVAYAIVVAMRADVAIYLFAAHWNIDKYEATHAIMQKSHTSPLIRLAAIRLIPRCRQPPIFDAESPFR